MTLQFELSDRIVAYLCINVQGLFLLKLRLNCFLLFYLQCLRDMEFIIIGQWSVEPTHWY